MLLLDLVKQGRDRGSVSHVDDIAGRAIAKAPRRVMHFVLNIRDDHFVAVCRKGLCTSKANALRAAGLEGFGPEMNLSAAKFQPYIRRDSFASQIVG